MRVIENVSFNDPQSLYLIASSIIHVVEILRKRSCGGEAEPDETHFPSLIRVKI